MTEFEKGYLKCAEILCKIIDEKEKEIQLLKLQININAYTKFKFIGRRTPANAAKTA